MEVALSKPQRASRFVSCGGVLCCQDVDAEGMLMAAEKWVLGAMRMEGNELKFADVRAISDDELNAFDKATLRLKHFSGHNLVGAVVASLNEFYELVAGMEKMPPQDLQGSAFRATFNAKLSNWLTTFTGFRAHIEKHAAQLKIPMGSSILADFKILYSQHPEYRLTWQLRNVDQHDPPVGDLTSISSTFDATTGKSIYRPMLDLAKLFSERIATGDRWARQWQECADLWAGRPDQVDLREVFRYASKACDSIVAIYIYEAEYLLVEDINLLARMNGEVLHLGYPCVHKLQKSDDGAELDIQVKPIDPLTFGECLISIDGARKTLGKPPLDLGNDPRFAPMGSGV